MPVNLSGGMKKRVGLARAIIRRPSCILYDEPTSGLDPVVSDSINRLIRRLQERFQVTSIVVTHDMKSAFHVADHIAYLHEGRIYFYGTPAELQRSDRSVDSGFSARPIGRSHRFSESRKAVAISGVAVDYDKTDMSQHDRGLEAKVGAFVFVGLAMLAALVVQFGRIGEGCENLLSADGRFADASGLLKAPTYCLRARRSGASPADRNSFRAGRASWCRCAFTITSKFRPAASSRSAVPVCSAIASLRSRCRRATDRVSFEERRHRRVRARPGWMISHAKAAR